MKKIVLAVILALVVVTAAAVLMYGVPGGSAPDVWDALSVRPERSAYIAGRVDDLSGTLGKIFSQDNIDAFAAAMPQQGAAQFRQQAAIAAALASQIPAKSAAFAFGLENPEVPFFQIAASMPDELKPEMDRAAAGEASPADIVTLLGGKAALPFAVMMPVSEARNGPAGPYYEFSPFNDGPVIAVKNGFLLIALPKSLEESAAALEDAGKRLALKRSFDTSDYIFAHYDVPTLASLSIPQASYLMSVMHLFKAPLEIEAAFKSEPGKFLVSLHANLTEALDIPEGQAVKPAPGANFFSVGNRELLAALALPIAFDPAALGMFPELDRVRRDIEGLLTAAGITEADVQDLLTGVFSFGLDGGSEINGARTPGVYAALTGRNGAAAKILAKITERLPLTRSEAEGWDAFFMIEPRFIPGAYMGVSGETLAVGITDSPALTGAPKLPAEAGELFTEPALSVFFVNAAGILDWCGEDLAGRNSLLKGILGMGGLRRVDDTLVKNITDAELMIPFVKAWDADRNTGFIEFTVADVPPEKRLLPKLISAAALSSNTATESAEASNIISNLREMKSACIMFYADNLDAVMAGKVTVDVQSLKQYMYRPETLDSPAYLVEADGGNWWVGYDLNAAGVSQGVRERLQSRAEATGLLGAMSAAPYNGGDVVWMRAR